MSEYRLSPQDVLTIFRDLPQHRGCDASLLDAAEHALGVVFPAFYREIMLLDAYRLYQTEIFLPVNELHEWTQAAGDDFVPGSTCTLTTRDVIFATALGGYDNYFFRADGVDDPPVYGLALNSARPGSPNVVADTLSFFTSEILRSFLRI